MTEINDEFLLKQLLDFCDNITGEFLIPVDDREYKELL